MSNDETIPNSRMTSRGFVVYDAFSDDNGNDVCVQESSAADEPKVWLTCDKHGEAAHAHLDLDLEQAKRVRDALDTFIREQGA